MSAPVQQHPEDAGITEYAVCTVANIKLGFEVLRPSGEWAVVKRIENRSNNRFRILVFVDDASNIYESHWFLKVRTPDMDPNFGEPATTVVKS